MTSKLLSAAAALVIVAAVSPQSVSAAVRCGNASLVGVTMPIYVSPTGNDTPSCGGTPADACAGIQQGIDRCAGRGSGCGVLVRYGLYNKATATIALRDGVSVYGGCVFDTTDDPRYRTVVQPNQAAGTPAISADAINTPTTVYGLVVIGKDEIGQGTASVAMTVSNSSGLALRTTVLVSGQGGPGTDGASATAVGPGGNGTAPDPAQQRWPGKGGPSCPAHPSDAGNGAPGSWQNFTAVEWKIYCVSVGPFNGAPSGSVTGGMGGAVGQGGVWCYNREFDYPGYGGNAQPGGAGQAGAQAIASLSIAGTIAATQWQPSTGGNGAAGAVGSGGGGGGNGGSCVPLSRSGDPYYGYGGGGGGGGGCGGALGTGGQQGGASIALLLSNSQVDLSDHSHRIMAGVGGRGGTGGSAVSGGAGGTGGGGVHSGQSLFWGHWCPGLSGDGGAGGPGGAGSGAAGGNGGPSIGIALTGSSRAPPDNGIYSGLPGNGGSHGRGGPAITANGVTSPAGPDGPDGLTGAAAAWFKY